VSDRVGFVGLGHMGAPMCEQVLRAGFATTVFDLRPEAVDAAVRRGARAAASAAGCAAAADVLVTMLPGPAQVEAVLLGDGGALAALAPGGLAMDMSTSSPALARRLAAAGAARGVGVIDAPVADALKAAEGMLHVFAGGPAEDVARARPVLEAMGDPQGIVHVGPSGAGQLVKLLVNLQWFVHAAAAAEALVMGVRAGIDTRTLHRVFAAGPARTSFIEHEALEVLQDGEYGERFPLGLVVKDLRLAAELAEETGVPAAVSATTRALYEQARERLGDQAGEMSVLALYEELTGTVLRFDAEDRHGG
jgi:3-hydroxyisobutyrate dehydrogenase